MHSCACRQMGWNCPTEMVMGHGAPAVCWRAANWTACGRGCDPLRLLTAPRDGTCGAAGLCLAVGRGFIVHLGGSSVLLPFGVVAFDDDHDGRRSLGQQRVEGKKKANAGTAWRRSVSVLYNGAPCEDPDPVGPRGVCVLGGAPTRRRTSRVPSVAHSRLCGGVVDSTPRRPPPPPPPSPPSTFPNRPKRHASGGGPAATVSIGPPRPLVFSLVPTFFLCLAASPPSPLPPLAMTERTLSSTAAQGL